MVGLTSAKGGPHTSYLTHRDYMLSGDGPQEAVQKSDVLNAVYCPIHWEDQVRKFYEDLTTQLVETKSERLRGDFFQLDAVREYVGRPKSFSKYEN